LLLQIQVGIYSNLETLQSGDHALAKAGFRIQHKPIVCRARNAKQSVYLASRLQHERCTHIAWLHGLDVLAEL
jgi:hypothetical protein